MRDEQTKAVTRYGTKAYNELQIGELILSINSETGKVEEKEIEEIIVQDYNGPMHLFNSRRMNLFVTPNNSMIYDQNSSLSWDIAKNMDGTNYKKYIIKGKIQEINHKAVINIPNIGDVDSNTFFYICGVFIGDGFTSYQECKKKNVSGFTRSEFLKECYDKKTRRFVSKKKYGYK